LRRINTALGTVGPEALGRTLAHEHLFINMTRERRGDGLLNDEAVMTDELKVFADQGGRSIFDLTSAELTPGSTVNASSRPSTAASSATRDPMNVAAIQRVSRATGVNVVLGTGHYRDPYLDHAILDQIGADGIADEIVRDITEGFPGTDAKAGIIGEIGADKWFVSALEERSFRGAARASVRTGVPVYTHAARWTVGRDQLDILFHEGVAPEKIAVGHTDTVPEPGFAVELAKRGVYVGIDTITAINRFAVQPRINQVLELVRAGHLEQILFGHDVCLLSQLRAFGGDGFGFVLGGFKEGLLQSGLTEEEFNVITITNPARLLS